MKPETRLSAQLPWVFTDRFFQEREQVDSLIYATLQHPYQQSVTRFSGQVNACIQHDLSDRLEQINASTLVLVGEADLLMPVKLSQALVMHLPDAKLQMIAAAGHNFFWETPQAFNQAVLSFLT